MAINYTEKGGEVHELVAAAGHWIEYRDGAGWITSDDAAVQAILDGYTIEQCRAWKKRLVDQEAQRRIDAFTAGLGYAPGEMASWPIMRAQAQEYESSGGTVIGDMLVGEAAASGVPASQLAPRVLANAAAFQAFLDAVKGRRTQLKIAIGTLDFAAVARYNISTGWPG